MPLIQQREVAAGKADGFSNPQIRVGKQITPVLQALEQRLQTAQVEPEASGSNVASAPAVRAP